MDLKITLSDLQTLLSQQKEITANAIADASVKTSPYIMTENKVDEAFIKNVKSVYPRDINVLLKYRN